MAPLLLPMKPGRGWASDTQPTMDGRTMAIGRQPPWDRLCEATMCSARNLVKV